jgi:hypothetical protein
VRSGGIFGTKHKVRAQTVQVALRSISSKFLLDGELSPLGTPETGYPKAIRQQLEGYKRQDPPPQPRLAVPLALPRFININGQNSQCPKAQAIGDMAIIAVYYLLRVGEYTYHRRESTTRTRQFTIGDIALWHNTTLLPKTHSEPTLMEQCTSATLSIVDQKNGRRNVSIHQEATGSAHCPIRAIIRRIKSILPHTRDPQTCISTYFPTRDSKYPRLVRATEMNTAVKHAVVALGLDRNGLTPALVGSHSLRAGGAMAMYLNGVPHATIKKMGRWTSDTFLMYIHEQISALSNNVSTRMSTPIVFHNIHFDRRQNGQNQHLLR